MTYDQLDDYQLEQDAGPGAVPVAPPIAGQADAERAARLDAERVTLQFGQKSTRRLDAGRRPIAESPLFGGDVQEGLF